MQNSIFAVLEVIFACNIEERNHFNFRHYNVSTDLPEDDGNRYGIPAIADFDNDGDLHAYFKV